MKCYMKSKIPGENAYSMFINEYPNGGFTWKFIDYVPENIEDYSPIYIYTEDLEAENKKLQEALKFYANPKAYEYCNDSYCELISYAADIGLDGGYIARKALGLE